MQQGVNCSPQTPQTSLQDHPQTSGPLLVALATLVTMVGLLQVLPSTYKADLTQDFVSLHILVELVGVVVAFGVFAVGWAAYDNTPSTDLVVLSATGLAVGALDLGHTLMAPGMPDLLGINGDNKHILFWLVARGTSAVAFLWVGLQTSRPFPSRFARNALLWALIGWSALWYWLIIGHVEWFPVMYIKGSGLTQTKIMIERGIGVIWVAACALFIRRGLRQDLFSYLWLASACYVYASMSFLLTLYQDIDALYCFVGHLFKVVASLTLFRAILVEAVSRPYQKAKLAEAAADEANRARARFLANVSHELRTPLGIISGFSEQLVQKAKLPMPQAAWVDTIARNSQQLRLLIDDLLDLAKADQEKITLHVLNFNALDVLSDVTSSLRLEAQKKGVRLDQFCLVNKQLLTITSDPFRLRQIFLNVIGNAVKFTSQGHVHVSIGLGDAQQFFVRVADTGVGIKTTLAQNLFQPFIQAEHPDNQRFGGTGLGLALSKRLCNLLGGDLRLESSQVDRGSTFIITLPTCSQLSSELIEHPQLLPAPEPQRLFDLKGLRVLIAEDSSDNQALLKVYFQGTGAALDFVVDGLEACEKASHQAFDLILMDIQMPTMDGFQATQRLRAQGWRGPILGLSAHAHQTERESALRGGFNDYLTKPISRGTLLKKIVQLIAPSRNISAHSEGL